jgi:hypothetical protein
MERIIGHWKGAILISAAALVPLGAHANPITYNFSVTATAGPLAGTTASGSFSFDSSNIPAALPGQKKALNLLTQLAFTWDGITYNATTANTGVLDFDVAGLLTIKTFFGNDPYLGGCAAHNNSENWCIGYDPTDPSGPSSFSYSIAGNLNGVFGGGTFTLREVPSVPEPATLALLGLGLAGLGFSRRKD